MQEALDATRAEVVVTLTAFYARVKQAQGRTAVRLVVATSIKVYLPPALRILFTLLKEKKDGHRITLQQGDSALRPAPETARGRGPARRAGRPR